MQRLSPSVKLAANALQQLTKDPLTQRVVLSDPKISHTAIAYHGDRCDGTIIVVLKNDKC